MSKKVMFLFGAGADADYNVGVGTSFSLPLIKSQYKKEINHILERNCDAYSLIHHNSRTVFLQTIHNHKEEAEKVFGKIIVNFITQYYNSTDKKTEELIKLKNEATESIINLDKELKCLYNNNEVDESQTKNKSFINPSDLIGFFCKSLYNLICNYSKVDAKEENKAMVILNYFKYNASFFDTLDEKFNSLRYLNDKRALRVQNAYWTAFLILFEDLYLKKDNKNERLDRKKFKYSFDEVLNTIIEFEQSNNDIWKSNKDTYYSLISNLLKNDYYVTTTNYTSIAEKETGNDVVYLHGKMNWFEDYQKLSVYDIIEEQNKGTLDNLKSRRDYLMPFILIPSGVKPLICKRQIMEFSKFINNLEECNILVVVGYRFNSEDNHINSIIREWLSDNSRIMIFFNYRKEKREDLSVYFDRLNWLNDNKIIDISSEDEISQIKIENYISVDQRGVVLNVETLGNNSISKFRELLILLNDLSVE